MIAGCGVEPHLTSLPVFRYRLGTLSGNRTRIYRLGGGHAILYAIRVHEHPARLIYIPEVRIMPFTSVVGYNDSPRLIIRSSRCEVFRTITQRVALGRFGLLHAKRQSVVPPMGFEPTSHGLEDRRSTP